MKKSYALLTVCVLVVLAGGISKASDAESIKSTLQGRYAEMKTAMAAHDDKALAALLAPDFVSVDVSGRAEGAAQMIQEVDALKPDPLKVSNTTLLSVETHDAVALVEQRYDMKTVKTAADGTKRNVELITLSNDTWSDASGTWLLQKSETEQLDFFVNGQRVAHQTRSNP